MYFDANEIIDLTMKSPKATIIFNGLKAILEDEKIKRERFYEEVQEDQKAEFINGEVVIHSPVKLSHNATSSNLFVLIHALLSKYHLGFVGYEKLMVRLTRNDYEPDVCFFLKEKSKKFKPDQMLFPAPDFIAEVLSVSTEKTDRTIKFEDYEHHGVKEYWIVDAESSFIEQYVLDNGKYKLYQKSGNGMIKSFVIEGFEIPVQAVFDKEINYVTMQKIMALT